jgi:hypothetical protein
MRFTDLVNITVEALVMQIVKFYFPRWDKGEGLGEEEKSEDSSDIGSKRSGGAEKGERLTCTRTAIDFYDYCEKIKNARESSFKAKWDERLQGEVMERHKKEMDEKKRKRDGDGIGKENSAGNVRTALSVDFMNGCWGGTYGTEDLPHPTQV